MGKIKGRLLKELKKLETKEFEEFKFYLEDYGNNKDRDILSISPSDLENANRIKTVDLIVHTYTKQALDVTCQVLQEVRRNDVKESLSQSNRGTSTPARVKKRQRQFIPSFWSPPGVRAAQPLKGCYTYTPHMWPQTRHRSGGTFPQSRQHQQGITAHKRNTQLPQLSTSTSQHADSSASRSAAPTTLIIGDSIIKDVWAKRIKCLMFRQATVSDLAEKISSIIEKYPTGSQIVINIGSNDIKHEQSELLKKDFNHLFDLLKRHPDKRFFISGPIPPLGRGSNRFSRLLSLHTWLESQCPIHGFIYIDNFNLFWKRVKYFKKDGLHPNRLGARMLTDNILHRVSVSQGESVIAENTCGNKDCDVVISTESDSNSKSLCINEQTESCPDVSVAEIESNKPCLFPNQTCLSVNTPATLKDVCPPNDALSHFDTGGRKGILYIHTGYNNFVLGSDFNRHVDNKANSPDSVVKKRRLTPEVTSDFLAHISLNLTNTRLAGALDADAGEIINTTKKRSMPWKRDDTIQLKTDCQVMESRQRKTTLYVHKGKIRIYDKAVQITFLI